MTARTDRIAKIDGIIDAATAAGKQTAKLTTLRNDFASMDDGKYDYLMAQAAALIANPKLSTQSFYRSYYTAKG